MTDYDLLIGDRSYSSWSLRGWLAFRAFGIPVKIHTTRFYQDGFKDDLVPFFPAKTVPVVKCSDGSVWTDSVAIVEELHSRHPEAGLLPSDPVLRAKARSLIAEMHSGFQTLRNDCPMNTRTAYVETPVSEALAADLARIELLWRDRSGPWLCGDYSMADAFYAPVAARIAGYALPVSEDAQSYVQQHLEHAPFRQFRAMGLTQEPQEFYVRDYPVKAWPGPAPIQAQAVDHGPSENETCPDSWDPVTLHSIITGCIFLALGISTLIFPGIFQIAYGLDLADMTTKNLVQSLVAGTEIALGVALLLNRRIGFDLATLIGLMALILITIGTIPLLTAIWFAHYHAVSLVECGIEISAALLLFSVYRAGRKAGTDV